MIDSSLTQQCVEKLQEAILSGTLPQGHKLKVNELKEWLHVGGSPIREALTKLVATGFVESQPNRGFYVTTLTPEGVRDLHHTYADIETLIIQRAILYGDAHWESQVVAAFHYLSTLETPAMLNNVRAYIDANRQFHAVIASACRSPLLIEIRELLELRLERCLWLHIHYADHESIRLNHAEHLALKGALLERDAAKAVEHTRQHILGGVEHLIAHLSQRK